MKKGIFIYSGQIDKQNLSGIDKKVLAQFKTFEDNGFDMKLLQIQKRVNSKFSNLIYAIRHRLPNGNINLAWPNIENIKEVEFIYFRRPAFISTSLIEYLNKLKVKNPTLKIIMEIPTFPYDGELNTRLVDKPILLKDKRNRKLLEGLVDRIAVQNNLNIIFNIPTLIFTNGIRVDDYTKRENLKLNGINICAIASLEPWQGYERVIVGLSNYYKEGGTENIQISFVGTGREETFYKNLVKEHNLQNNIHFLGFLSGKELDDVYSNSDIALDAFGRYKTGNEISTSLKSREYLAKGLPIISGSKIDILDSADKYYYEFPSNSSAIYFKNIVSFFNNTYQKNNKQEVIDEIRQIAREKCDMSISMKNILDYVSENKE